MASVQKQFQTVAEKQCRNVYILLEKESGLLFHRQRAESCLHPADIHQASVVK